MPSQADRLLRIAHAAIDKLERRVTLLEQRLDHVPDRVDDIEDQLATIETRLTHAGFPRDLRPADRRTVGQREADRLNQIINQPPHPAGDRGRDDITAPGFPDDAA